MDASQTCPVCGRDFGFFGATHASEHLVEYAKKNGEYTSGMCADCIRSIAEKKERDRERKREENHSNITKLFEKAINDVRVYTTNTPDALNEREYGMVTGYSAIGTGPISSFAIKFADFFGANSLMYSAKLKKAEKEAMYIAKYDALQLGCDAIYACSINVTEGTAAEGVLIVSVFGTAVRTDNSSENIKKFIEANEEFNY